MSIHEQPIADLNSLYTHHPELFSPDVRTSLSEALSDLSENDSIYQIATALTKWYKTQPKIRDALFKLPPPAENEMGPRGRPLVLTSKVALALLKDDIASAPENTHKTSSKAQKEPSVISEDPTKRPASSEQSKHE